ncbi:hypothetical protein BDR05DRAFT_996437 [Suillus weaverae]|nr:hypothetical protein BDR05DRAFT_996437 [Suillus weaverae]
MTISHWSAMRWFNQRLAVAPSFALLRYMTEPVRSDQSVLDAKALIPPCHAHSFVTEAYTHPWYRAYFHPSSKILYYFSAA